MLRSKLQNQYLKCKSAEARTRFNIQRNLCVTLLRNAKLDYYENLDLGKVNDSKKFWNTVKPTFGNKVTTRINITLTENKKVLTSETELAKTFNKYFVDIVPKLGMKTAVSSAKNDDLETGNLSAIIKKIICYHPLVFFRNVLKLLKSSLRIRKTDCRKN